MNPRLDVMPGISLGMGINLGNRGPNGLNILYGIFLDIPVKFLFQCYDQFHRV